MVTLTNEDNMSLMARYPEKYFNCALIDPPYGILKMGRGAYDSKEGSKKYSRFDKGSGKLKNRILNTMGCDWDFEPPTAEYWTDIFRVAENVICFGGNYFPLPPTRGISIWDKKQPWENFSQFELIWSNFDKPAHIFTVSNTGNINAEKKIHPTQKPVALLKKVLAWYGIKPGWKILDTGTGSGSLAIACIDMGIDLVGCEKNKEYFDTSMKWIKEYQSQQELFSVSEMISKKENILFDQGDEM